MISNKKKKGILNKFWHNFSNDLYCLNSSEFKGLERYFKGYSNGLLEADVISINEHIEITDKVSNKINQERVLRECRLKRLLQA